MKNLIPVLEDFCDKDDTRLLLQAPFLQDDKIVATNGYRAIIVDAHLIPDHKYKPLEKPNATMQEFIDRTEDGTPQFINIAELKSAIYATELVDGYDITEEETDCKECNGDGEVMYEYRSSQSYSSHKIKDECPECGGEGTVYTEKKIPTGTKVFNPDLRCAIGASHYSLTMVNTLVIAGEQLGINEFKLTTPKTPTYPGLFRAEGITIILMPMLAQESMPPAFTINPQPLAQASACAKPNNHPEL